MAKKIAHRSTEDTEWQETKEKARERDKNMCVLCRLLSPKEYALFQRSRPIMTNIIEVAHIKSVGNHVELTYDVDNVVCLCHAMHSRLDSMQDPVTGFPIKRSVHEEWWNRIIAGRNALSSEEIYCYVEK